MPIRLRGGGVSITWGLMHRTTTGHVHGLLRVTIGNHDLPWMGYSGPEDVCFHTWARVLEDVLSMGKPVIFDDGEQGQPAFVFQRDGTALYVSVTEGMGGGVASREWQRVPCSWADFCHQAQAFIQWYRTMDGNEWPGIEPRPTPPTSSHPRPWLDSRPGFGSKKR